MRSFWCDNHPETHKQVWQNTGVMETRRSRVVSAWRPVRHNGKASVSYASATQGEVSIASLALKRIASLPPSAITSCAAVRARSATSRS